MEQTGAIEKKKAGRVAEAVSWLGRLFLAVIIPVIAFVVIYEGFIFLRDSQAPRWVTALVAIVWGVGGVALLYWVFNGIVERLPDAWTQRLQPFVFVGPAMAILIWYLALPAVRTFYLSLFDRDGVPKGVGFFESFASDAFVGLQNYVAMFSERLLTEALRNNLMWIVFGSTLSVLVGLLVATLADRSKFERVAKSLIFLPMAISFVGASVIWNFMYEIRPADEAQIGLLNAIIVGLGRHPLCLGQVRWTIAPWNNLFLILIVIWLQAGFAMVLFSAALKGHPRGDPGSGPGGRRHRDTGLLQDHDPLHHGHDHHGRGRPSSSLP